MKNLYYLVLGLLTVGIFTNGCTTELVSKKTAGASDRTAQHNGTSQDQITTFILVRHAEKATGKNPSLTTAGKARAIELAAVLDKVEVDAIYSTNYNRTLETAKPTADRKNIDITNYNPSDLTAFAQTLLSDSANRTTLIVGHSNTTPDLINILLKENRLAQLSEKDYDDLFILTLSQHGDTQLLPLKYGDHQKHK